MQLLRKVIAVVVCLLAFTGVKGVAETTVLPTYTTTHTPDEAEAFFSFPSGESERYYTDPLVAVIIEAVYADGVALTGLPTDAAKGTVGTNTFRPVLPSRMIYRLSCKNFISARSRDIDGTLAFKRYEIPMDSKKIEINFRIRYPNGRMSQEMMLVSLNAYEFRAINDK